MKKIPSSRPTRDSKTKKQKNKKINKTRSFYIKRKLPITRKRILKW